MFGGRLCHVSVAIQGNEIFFPCEGGETLGQVAREVVDAPGSVLGQVGAT